MSALPKTSFAMVQTAIETLEPRDIPMPDIDEDSAILKLEACGICGSDYEQYEGQLRTPMLLEWHRTSSESRSASAG